MLECKDSKNWSISKNKGRLGLFVEEMGQSCGWFNNSLVMEFILGKCLLRLFLWVQGMIFRETLTGEANNLNL